MHPCLLYSYEDLEYDQEDPDEGSDQDQDDDMEEDDQDAYE